VPQGSVHIKRINAVGISGKLLSAFSGKPVYTQPGVQKLKAGCVAEIIS
jgi:hypothetical protein